MLRFLTIPTAKQRFPPVVPTGLRIYAIGDVHGRADCLEQVFSRIDRDKERYPVDEVLEVYLGDFVDRGPESCVVIELLRRRSARRQTIYLTGNHETMLIESLEGDLRAAQWCLCGALETMASYGIRKSEIPDAQEWYEMLRNFRAVFPTKHMEFLSRCRTSFSCGSYFFVHAGIRPGVPLHAQLIDDLLWIRQPFLNSSADHGAIVVHGHTPVDNPEIHPNRINLDTGAYMTGKLSCIALEGNEQMLI